MAKEPSKDEFGLQLFDEVIAAFNKHGVDFMIIGGFAVVYHGFVRATQDLDIFVRRSEENAKKVVAALKELSDGDLILSPEAFTKGKGVLIGDVPSRVDVLSQIAGVEFDQTWKNCKMDRFGPAKVRYISLEDLISNKRASNRPQDIADVRELENRTNHGQR